MTVGKQIKLILSYKDMTVVDLSKKMGYNSSSALYNRFKRDDFSEKDLEKICEVLDCDYKVVITMRDTGISV